MSNTIDRNNANTILDQGWIVRVSTANSVPARMMVMLHGWTGDENSMNVFQRDVPADYTIFSPRGRLKANTSGYSWTNSHNGTRSTREDFSESVEALHQAIDRWAVQYNLPRTPLTLAGFSQGAAFCLAYAMTYPQELDKVIAMAGFTPALAEDYPLPAGLEDIRFFIAHGTADDTVPVAMAHDTVRLLESYGAQVQYCESNTGHRMSADCLHKLAAFMRNSKSVQRF